MNKKVVLIALAVIAVIVISGIIGAEYYTSQPQFCGSCHIMKHYYQSWEKDTKHREKGVACVDCHYRPGEKRSLRAKFKGLGQLFSYVSTFVEAKEVRTRTTVHDVSCTTSDCHPEQKLKDKEAKFTEKIPYVHKTHFDKTVEGQKMHCATCHSHVKAENHFEVPKEICYICHFKDTKFNEGRSKCTLCHQLPEKPIEKEKEDKSDDEKPITHKSIEEANVACHSCHYQLVQGTGEVKLEDCQHCHHHPEILEKVKDKKLMHTEHIAAQHAKCFDCHRPITHKETPPFEVVLQNCTACHPEPHIFQQMLLAGAGGAGINKTYPIAHYDVKVNCLACHVEDSLDEKGRKFKKGSHRMCTECHLKDEEKQRLAGKWKEDVMAVLEEAREIEKETIAAIEEAKGKVSEETMAKARVFLEKGQENIRIVDAGGGVHNKKYAMLLLDVAIEQFDNALAELE